MISEQGRCQWEHGSGSGIGDIKYSSGQQNKKHMGVEEIAY